MLENIQENVFPRCSKIFRAVLKFKLPGRIFLRFKRLLLPKKIGHLWKNPDAQKFVDFETFYGV